MHVTHIHVAKVPIKREHVNNFCLISSLTLMGVDAIHSVFFPHLMEHMEAVFGGGGKIGATLAAIPPILETCLKRVR